MDGGLGCSSSGNNSSDNSGGSGTGGSAKRAVTHCRQTDTDTTQHHGCRVIIALSDTGRRPDTRPDKPGSGSGSGGYSNSNGNMAIYAKSHAGQKDVQLRQVDDRGVWIVCMCMCVVCVYVYSVYV